MIQTRPQGPTHDAIAHHLDTICTALAGLAMLALPIFLALKYAGVLA